MRSLIIITLALVQMAFHLCDGAATDSDGRRQRCMLESNEPNYDEKACNACIAHADYLKNRQQFIKDEFDWGFGSDVSLNEYEHLANKIIMNAKESEYQAGLIHPYLFHPSRHIFEILDVIKQSKLFQIIQQMPKGGILHAHDTALVSPDFIVSITYCENLWQLTPANSNDIIEFIFSQQKPENKSNHNGTVWRLVSDVRAEIGASKYDAYVRSLFTLFDKNVNPLIQFTDINDVWNRFMTLFIRLTPIVTYAPVWKAYYKHALKEMLADGVQYLEFRGILPQQYDFSGKVYTEDDTMQVYVEALNEFKNEQLTPFPFDI